MPNRLKINLDFGKDALLGVGSNNEGKLNVKWLFGTPAKSLKAKIDATLTPKKMGFQVSRIIHFIILLQISAPGKQQFLMVHSTMKGMQL